MTPEERLAERLKLSKPVAEAFFAWSDTVNALKGSKLAKAIDYARTQREPLSAFLKDGRVELSNNPGRLAEQFA